MVLSTEKIIKKLLKQSLKVVFYNCVQHAFCSQHLVVKALIFQLEDLIGALDLLQVTSAVVLASSAPLGQSCLPSHTLEKAGWRARVAVPGVLSVQGGGGSEHQSKHRRTHAHRLAHMHARTHTHTHAQSVAFSKW